MQRRHFFDILARYDPLGKFHQILGTWQQHDHCDDIEDRVGIGDLSGRVGRRSLDQVKYSREYLGHDHKQYHTDALKQSNDNSHSFGILSSTNGSQ